jgi:cobalt/nickel transport system permease protein
MFLIGFVSGGAAILIGSVLLSLTLLFTGEEFLVLAGAVLVSHVPVVIVEGLVTGAALSFLRKVRPEALSLSLHLKESTP